jgi:hypothetical protein
VEQKSATGRAYLGLTLSAFALVFCVPLGILFVSVATGAVGIILGIVGYALGARKIGFAAVVLCAAAMFLGLLVGQGAIPNSYDVALDGVKEALQAPFSDPTRAE